jgi:hypothetical protein
MSRTPSRVDALIRLPQADGRSTDDVITTTVRLTAPPK